MMVLMLVLFLMLFVELNLFPARGLYPVPEKSVDRPAPALLPFWQEKWQNFSFPARVTGKSRKIAG